MAVGGSPGDSTVSVTFTGDASSLEEALEDLSSQAEQTSGNFDDLAEQADNLSSQLEDANANAEDLQKTLAELDGDQVAVTVDEDGDAKENLDQIKSDLDELEADKDTSVEVNETGDAKEQLDEIKADLDDLETDKDTTVTVTADTTEAQTGIEDVKQDLADLQKDATVTVSADTTDAQTAIEDVDKDVKDLQKDAEITVSADATQASTNLDDLKKDVDELDTAADITVTADTAEATTEVDDLKKDLDELDLPVTINIGGEGEDASGTIDDLKTKVAELQAMLNLTFNVDDTEAEAKIDDLHAQVDELTDTPHTVKITVEAEGADAQDILDAIGAGGAGAGGIGSKDAAGAADALSEDMVDSVLTAMGSITAIPAAAGLAATAASGLAGGLAGMILSGIGAGAFTLAISGAGNPVKNNFKIALDKALTQWDKSLSGVTGPALNSLLTPITAWLDDAAPLVEGFAKGLTSFAKDMSGLLDEPAVKKIFSEMGSASGQDTAQLGPMLGNFLKGMGQLLVEAEPLEEAVASAANTLMKSFASASAGKAEGTFFSDSAKNFAKLAPEVDALLDQMVHLVGDFMDDMKPLEGVALKGMTAAAGSVGDVLKDSVPIVQAMSDVLQAIEKLPGGSTAVGLPGLLLLGTKLPIIGKAFEGVASGMAKVITNLPGVQKVFGSLENFVNKVLGTNLGKGTSTGSETSSADTLKSAAGTFSDAVDKFGEYVNTMKDAAKAETTAASEEETAGKEELTAGGEEDVAGEENDVAAGGKASGFLSSLVSGGALGDLSGAVAGLGTAVALPAALLALPAVLATLGKTHTATAANTDDTTRYGTKSQQEAYELAIKQATETGHAVNNLTNQVTSTELTNIENLERVYQTQGKKNAQALGEGLIAGLAEYNGQSVSAAKKGAEDVIDGTKTAFGIKSPSSVYETIGENLMLGEEAGIKGDADKPKTATKTMATDLVRVMTGAGADGQGAFVAEFKEVGQNLILGLAGGISSQVGAAEKAVTAAVNDILGTAQSVSGTHSPSTVYAELAKNWMLGLAEGVSGNVGVVNAAMSKAVAAVPVSASARGTTASGGGVVVNQYFQSMTGTFDQNSINQIKQAAQQVVNSNNAAMTAGLRGI